MIIHCSSFLQPNGQQLNARCPCPKLNLHIKNTTPGEANTHMHAHRYAHILRTTFGPNLQLGKGVRFGDRQIAREILNTTRAR